jgi:hypothetical protein
MKLRFLVLGTLAGAGALIGLATSASAYVVCNNMGDCWHTDQRYDYGRPGVRFETHPDDWYFHRTWSDRDRWRWRTYHEGRGYWGRDGGRDGVWITF